MLHRYFGVRKIMKNTKGNKMKHLSIDGFAGGGGASCGLKMAGIDVTIAINHDPAAIRMHTVNHPKTLHLTEDIFKVDLAK